MLDLPALRRRQDRDARDAGRRRCAPTSRPGEPAAAEAAWLTAHLTWLQIGQDDGAYGAFGELGRRSTAPRPASSEATASPSFTGFHKLELDLWTRDDLAAAGPTRPSWRRS